MSKFASTFLFVAAVATILTPAFAQEFVRGRLLVQAARNMDEQSMHKTLAAHGLVSHRSIASLGVTVLEGPERTLDSAAAALLRSGQFTFVERDGVAHGGGVPNDPDFPSQWHLATVQAANAWDVTSGSAGVTIAMIDSGVDGTHPDLATKLVPGWSFLTGTSNTSDVLGHGTATAGTAAAATNNGIGVAGLAANNTIMPLVVLNSSDYASYSDIASAITYAADHGVRIINISIGGSSASSTLQSAVDYAWNKGAVIFASAMNNSSSTPYYPAACNNVVAVSATEPNDTLATFSNYGTWIDLAAPGDNILTTNNGGGYGTWWGTSFASPIAAATAALVLSVNPSLTASGLVSLLEQNSDDIGDPGYDQYFGWGRINAYRAVSAAGVAPAVAPPPTVAINNPLAGSTVAATVSVQGLATDSSGITKVEFYVDNVLNATGTSASFSFGWNSATSPNGSHSLVVKAYDPSGQVGSATASVTVSNVITADTQAPSVVVTNPLNGSNVNGVTQVAVSATDNVGVTQVSIYIDNVLKANLTSAPYTYNWNTRKSGAGPHNIYAKAWDAAGNVGTSSVITVQH
ncbi:MAG TPA: alkaline serine protease [Solibacterales bacterium]|nr:alkaline serine protease [Bryobacterales bacterium]